MVKPILMVATDGYILDIHGPYFSDGKNNDAAILKNEFQRNLNGINDWFEEGDIFLVNRGYRDVVPFLNDHGTRVIVSFQPRWQMQHV